MGIKLYFTSLSAPCRAAALTAATVGVDVELINVNLLTGENKTPEFLKLNPLHSVPVLVDGDLVLTENRAIITYLASAYAKSDDLYPKDVKKRALVDQRLYFDATTLYKCFTDAYYVIFLEQKLPAQPKVERLDEILSVFDASLAKSAFSAGETFTVADIGFVVTLTTIEAAGHDISKYSSIQSYLKKSIPLIKGYEHNVEGNQVFKSFVDGIRNQLQG